MLITLCRGIAADGAVTKFQKLTSRNVLIECWTQLILNTLTHSDRSAAKKLTTIMYAKGAQLPMLNFI